MELKFKYLKKNPNIMGVRKADGSIVGVIGTVEELATSKMITLLEGQHIDESKFMFVPFINTEFPVESELFENIDEVQRWVYYNY